MATPDSTYDLVYEHDVFGRDYHGVVTTTEPTPESIAALLEQTSEGRNVRALLLRELDDDDQVGSPVETWQHAVKAGFVCEPATGPSYALTPLGRLVAEACRPKPWKVFPLREVWTIRLRPGSLPIATTLLRENAERIAALLTADDLAKAKRFEVVP